MDHKKTITNDTHHQSSPHYGNRCKSTEFQCLSDGACIEGYKKCNNYGDCSDYSDENDCNEITSDFYGNEDFISKNEEATIYLIFNFLVLA